MSTARRRVSPPGGAHTLRSEFRRAATLHRGRKESSARPTNFVVAAASAAAQQRRRNSSVVNQDKDARNASTEQQPSVPGSSFCAASSPQRRIGSGCIIAFRRRSTSTNLGGSQRWKGRMFFRRSDPVRDAIQKMNR